MSAWHERAKHCEEIYGSFVDWEEEYFLCPFCGDPVLAEDWEDSDFSDDMICPICEDSDRED